MATTATSTPQEAAKSIAEFIIKQMRTGASNAAIAQRLVTMGLDSAASGKLVDQVSAEVIRTARQQQPTAAAVLVGLLGGGVAAVLGGVVWGLIVTRISFEIGYMAWGLGWLAGSSVVLFARGKKGTALQLIAVVASVAGITVGKYIVFAMTMRQVVLERLGGEAAARVTVLSAPVLKFFVNHVPKLLSPYDALWIVLAVLTAWRIPRSLGIKPPAQIIGE